MDGRVSIPGRGPANVRVIALAIPKDHDSGGDVYP